MSELSKFKRLCGCREMTTWHMGKTYDHRLILHHWGYSIRSWFLELPRGVRFFIGYRLRWLACKVMGEKWYVADAWHGVPGNRAAELQQQIFEQVVSLSICNMDDEDKIEARNSIDRKLTELAQAAGESWGACLAKRETMTRNAILAKL